MNVLHFTRNISFVFSFVDRDIKLIKNDKTPRRRVNFSGRWQVFHARSIFIAK